LPSINDFPAGVPTRLLGLYFPCIIFIPEDNPFDLDILNYINYENDRWNLRLTAMSKNKHFYHLFHDEFCNEWDEAKAKARYGRPDVIMFFIGLENDRFLLGFSELCNASMVSIEKDSILEGFFDELNFDNAMPVWEGWDFSKLVTHKPRKIYGAFMRYAHREYTLMGFGLYKIGEEDVNTQKKCGTDQLLLMGNKLIDEIVMDLLPEIMDFVINRLASFYSMIQDILETVSTGESIYVPTNVDNFIKQLRGRITVFLKNKYLDNPEQINFVETFNSSERKTINNHMKKIGKYVFIKIHYSEYRSKWTGTYREKINFLHQMIMDSSIREQYPADELETIHGLYLKQFPLESMEKQLFDVKSGKPFPLSDTIEDKNEQPIIDTFKDEFKKELDIQELKEFLERVLEYLKWHRSGNTDALTMTNYYKNKLFSEFCVLAGIAIENELKVLFIERLNIIINDYNNRLIIGG